MSDPYNPGGKPPSSGTPTSQPRQDARDAANEVGRQADRLADEAKTQAGNLRDQAASAMHDATAQVRELAGSVTDQARQVVEEQKSAGADRISGLAHAVHRAAGEFDDEVPVAAHYVREAAAGLESVSRALRRRSVDDIIGTVEDFARSQPVAFFSGAVVAGFALSRFLKSSADRRAGISLSSTGSHAYRGGSYGSPSGSAGAGSGAAATSGAARPGAGATGTGSAGTGTGWTGIGALPGTDSGIRPGAVGLSGSRPGVATGSAGTVGPSGVVTGASGGQMASGDPGGISPQAPGFTPHPVEPGRASGPGAPGAGPVKP